MEKSNVKRKVFNLGFSKTGTTSVENALALLGYNVCRGHYNNNYTNFLIALYVNKDYKELFRFTTQFDAFADGPWGGGELYLHLPKEYPEAHYILTVRDAGAWYASFEKMLTRFDPDLSTTFDTFYSKGRYGTPLFFRHVFGIESMKDAREKMIAYYNAYNRNVQEHFRQAGIPLLVMDLAKGDGWKELCPFLGHPIVNEPFPHLNKAKNAGDNTAPKTDPPAQASGGFLSRIFKR